MRSRPGAIRVGPRAVSAASTRASETSSSAFTGISASATSRAAERVELALDAFDVALCSGEPRTHLRHDVLRRLTGELGVRQLRVGRNLLLACCLEVLAEARTL